MFEIPDSIQLDISGSPAAIAKLLADIGRPVHDQKAARGEPPPVVRTGANTPPQIGQYWPGQGGLYAGVSRGVDGQVDAHLILAAIKPDGDKNWDAALAWAFGVSADGHNDFRLPSRAESALLFANLKDEVGAGWHWTNEQYSRTSAWLQYFDVGNQHGNVKSYEGRARAVRRFIP